ncbi:Gluconate utilization system GNT-I transcriptional repressor [Serratia liquefaciens]|jgi:LacI family transcriptional regulator, gluconate utilization system Gnt-II transcriptional activator|uniref:LacI family DNA-binding transcriptional regulator n=1 Tax=Serratia liquefaciens TaxID=614 RepID=A0A379YL40_SERLI|nr:MULTISPECIES: LacI family DNA-binding transcriptional regulator [Serratia]AGQ32075.1 transcriptional regulator [Serratia liquefaciens ATCC 27592]AKE09575.1 transcriptional regulator [Serratia liquefaciens]AMH01303.1 transcriptional regulator [Serratia liquefaciens]AYO39065.1 LacI family DNA-binding transcriptional regulator [Serratia sp. P2ACOL2]MBH2811412.1 LacI family DNA-binding transcriptional regulator [Serratia liquefaciens]
MKNQRVTLQDIALLAGVTKMTVSRYLRTPEKVAAETAEKIAQVMKEVNFTDGDEARSTQKPRIGVLIPSFNNQIFADLLAGIESITLEQGYQTLVVNYDYSRQREEEHIVQLLAYPIAGLILTDSEHTLRAEKYLTAAKIPVAQVMDLEGPEGRIAVGFDNFQAGYDMTEALLASGKRQVVYFGAMSDARDTKRFQGYCRAMEKQGLTPRQITPHRVSSVTVGSDMLAMARQLYPDLDGILCTNDDLAVGVLQECLRLGLRVPQDIALSGFHGLDIGKATTPGIASVITPRFDIGKVATEILLKRIKGVPCIERVDLHYRISLGGTI